MRAKDAQRLGTIRLLMAAMKQKEVDERMVLEDSHIVAIVDKLIKQRKDSIEAFTKANRQDLVDQEASELLVLEQYLPPRLSLDEVKAEVATLIERLGARSAADMGKVMAAAKTQLAGKTDMTMVSQVVKAMLGS
ncbi:unnamed protein product [Darwinula stevensoni]|uniref:GatB/YqeY domain-containing protein n=1 Tax=Darwinula stevensoni TaxID=69355 RepID=A0A7R9A9R0_9CRUS|nr:unnamed protein product [Darwinula stevensoni]CAG0897669.1 unnamed protein product [Darwinula stevensoni]